MLPRAEMCFYLTLVSSLWLACRPITRSNKLCLEKDDSDRLVRKSEKEGHISLPFARSSCSSQEAKISLFSRSATGASLSFRFRPIIRQFWLALSKDPVFLWASLQRARENEDGGRNESGDGSVHQALDFTF